MTNDRLWALLSARIGAAVGTSFVVQSHQRMGGGCINRAYRLHGAGRSYFVKLNEAHRLPLFEAEAAGLVECAGTAALRLPQPVCCGTLETGPAYLVLEYLPLRPAGDGAMETLGRGLALLHQAVRPYFGWHRDNAIGSTPQVNSPSNDWRTFWIEHRLAFQLDLAAGNDYGGELQRLGRRLLTRCGAFFQGHEPLPALVHGDLWSGNVASDAQGEPVIFDPAVYYADRETDLAMTELFGGFSPRFYAAYREAYPLDEGYTTRRSLYNLYHVLNHLNLFGGGYLVQAQRTLQALLAELG